MPLSSISILVNSIHALTRLCTKCTVVQFDLGLGRIVGTLVPSTFKPWFC